MAAAPVPLSLVVYRLLTARAAFLLEWLLKLRVAWGKEDPVRLPERRGEASEPRPKGFLVWIHAASVGEANSVLSLVATLLETRPVSILVTTATLTSASLLTQRLPKSGARHQFVPLDHPRWAAAFLDHWRPELGLFVESELWPNLLLAAEKRGVPLVLLNARLSARSFQRWRLARGTAARLLACFSLCLAQDGHTAARLKALGASEVDVCGNLKFVADPLPDMPAERRSLEAELGTRPRLVAASTHEGEESLLAAAARTIRASIPDFLLILVPRHPERGAALARSLHNMGFTVALRSAHEPIRSATEIYVADTLGELGLFYRLAPLAFVGGSLVPHGGQNPLEPARLHRFVLHGPHIGNFAESYAALEAVGGAQLVTAESIADTVATLLTMPEALAARGDQAASAVREADQVLARVLAKLEPYLPPALSSRRDGCA